MNEGWMMDGKTAMVFFRYLRRYKIPDGDEKTRIEVLRRLTAKKKAKYIRDPQEFIKGKKALLIGRKKDERRIGFRSVSEDSKIEPGHSDHGKN